jgi:hypothetical protein
MNDPTRFFNDPPRLLNLPLDQALFEEQLKPFLAIPTQPSFDYTAILHGMKKLNLTKEFLEEEQVVIPRTCQGNFLVLPKTFGLCCYLRINCGNTWQVRLNWNLPSESNEYNLAASTLLTYSLNKFLVGCFKLDSKKQIAYMSPQRKMVISSCEVLDTRTILLEDAHVVFRYSEPWKYQHVDWAGFAYFKRFPLHFNQPLDGATHRVLLDFVFIECTPQADIYGLELGWQGYKMSGTYQRPPLVISESNSILLQRTKQTDIWAIALEWQEPLESVRQVKTYIKTVYKSLADIGNVEELNKFPYKINEFMSSSPRLIGRPLGDPEPSVMAIEIV